MSELPRRTSRLSLGQSDRQPAEAGTSVSDASAAAPAIGGAATMTAPPVAMLAAADIEAIAARVAELLDRPPHRLLKVDEVAALLAVDPAFVYAHQHELGVMRLPTKGRRPALRFDRDAVVERLRRARGSAHAAITGPKRRPAARRPQARADFELLPFEPRSAAHQAAPAATPGPRRRHDPVCAGGNPRRGSAAGTPSCGCGGGWAERTRASSSRTCSRRPGRRLAIARRDADSCGADGRRRRRPDLP
jgi:hypothetical protein